jgi:hypothetical protein
MNASLQAHALWRLWVKEQALATQASSFPFYERVESLLAKQTLSDVLNALFAQVETLEPTALFPGLMTQVQRMAQRVQHTHPNVFHSLLVALPVQHDAAALAGLPDRLWEGVEQYVQHRFATRLKSRRSSPLRLAITAVPGLVAPDACACLNLDEVHGLTQELAQGQPGALAQRLLAEQVQVARTLPATAPLLSVAVITHNAHPSAPHEALDGWLSELDPHDWVWSRFGVISARATQPPRSFIDTLTQALLQRLEAEVNARCHALGTSVTQAAIAWTDMTEEGDFMHLMATVDGVAVPPVIVPCGWFSLAGPMAIGDVLGMWDDSSAVHCDLADDSADVVPFPSR